MKKTFRAGEKVAKAHLDRREMQYLYSDSDGYIFMDNETYEQITIFNETIGDGVKWLLENMNLHVLIFQNKIIGVDLPNFRIKSS